jgi:hypothetical protein
MKKFLFALSFPLLFACGENPGSETDYSTLTFTVDTVLVDSKDEILYLKAMLNTSALSKDKKHLYNFNNDLTTLELIDLEELKFLESHPFEKEGPDGTGSFVQSTIVVDEDQILLNAFQQSGVFNKVGTKTRNISLRFTDYKGEVPEGIETLNHPIMLQDKPDFFYGLFKDYEFKSLFMGKIDLEQKIFDRIQLPEFAYLKNYFVQLIGDKGYPEAILSPATYLVHAGNRLVFAHMAASDVYVFDTDSDSLTFKAIPHTLFADRKTGKYPSTVGSMEEFQKVNRTWGEEINFRAPLWNDEKHVFYRFATKNIWKEVEGKPKVVGAEVYLVIMDPEFNVLAEQKVEELTKNPGFHFLKDGKIWIFENMEDEMGFVRLSLN